LRFGEMNNARTPGTPGWLQRVRTSGTIQIQLQAHPRSLLQDASIMMLASDYWHTDFAITQDQRDLVVYLRRPGSDVNGGPPFIIGRILGPKQWTSVTVMLQAGDLRIDVDGRSRLTAHLPPDSTRIWSQGQIALGDEVHGGKPWQGQIRRAQVSTSGYTVDYVRPGRLAIPQSYLYHPDHILPFPPLNRGEWLDAFLDMLSFIPLGFLIVLARRPPVRPVSATLIAAAFALLLSAGKFLFDGRHTSLADFVLQVAGGLLGALLASRLAHARNGNTSLRGRRHPRAAVDSGTSEHRHA
jgi:hypothetical protein